jgi:hypothetical protein
MNILQIDSRLSKYFEIWINNNSRQLILSRSANFRGFGTLVRHDDDYYFDVLIPKSSNIEQLRPFFTLINIQERPLYYVSREKIEDNQTTDIIKKLDEIPGLVISYTGIEPGYMVIKGFMHKNSECYFSDLLSEHIRGRTSITKVILKPSRGFLDLMRNINIGLKNIIISLPMKEFDQYRVIKMLRDTGSIGQFIDNYTVNGQFRMIIYSDRSLSDVEGLDEISAHDHVYETRTDDEILLILAAKAMKERITWIFFFIYTKDDKIYLNFILPDFRARDYFKLIVDTEMDLKKLDWVTLESYSEFNPGDINDGLNDEEPI